MKQKDMIAAFIREAFNRGNTDIIQACIHPDYRYVSPSEQLSGRSELTAFVTAFREAFMEIPEVLRE